MLLRKIIIGMMTVFINPVFAFLTRVAVMIMQALGLQVVMPELQPDAFPFWDSCMMVLSIVAMILMTRKYVEMVANGAPAEELEALGVGSLHRATHEGDVENGSVMIGEISGMLNDIKPVQKIIDDIVAGLPSTIDMIQQDLK